MQPEQNEETRIQKKKQKQKQKPKNEEKIRGLWDISKSANIWIIGVPEEENEEEIGNLFEKIMKDTSLIW